MENRIHIIGAAGSGTSTLGEALSSVLPHIHLDTDSYYFSDGIEFTEKRSIPERIVLLKKDFYVNSQWILTGSLYEWGDELKDYFDLVIYLWIPEDIRLKRLKQREFERYGEEIYPGGNRHIKSSEFLSWASKYDKGGLEVRSRISHEEWLSRLTCPVIKIEGDYSVADRVNIILDHLQK